MIELRVLPQDSSHMARYAKGGFIAVGYGTQLAQATLNPTLFALLAKSIGTPVGKGAQNLIPIAAVTPPPPCHCQNQNISTQAGQGTPGSPNSIWDKLAQQEKAQQLRTPYINVIIDYCAGSTVDGIEFIPQSPEPPKGAANAASCDPASPNPNLMHIRQFVMTSCAGSHCGASYQSSCGGTRQFGLWYLDECDDKLAHYGTTTTDLMLGNTHVISDEPTPNIPGSDAAIVRTFNDFVMCGNQVMDAFTWTRSGVGGTSSPSWCTSPGGAQGDRSALQQSQPAKHRPEHGRKLAEELHGFCSASSTTQTPACSQAMRDSRRYRPTWAVGPRPARVLPAGRSEPEAPRRAPPGPAA